MNFIDTYQSFREIEDRYNLFDREIANLQFWDYLRFPLWLKILLLSTNYTSLKSFTLGNCNSDLSVGLTRAFLCCKYYGTEISHNPKAGVILNISSDLGIIASDQNLYCDNKLKENEQPVKPMTYSVIKSGLIGLTRYISTYWPKKVRCNALCLGGVHVSQSDEFLRRIKEKIPMRRMANLDEYQGTIIYMLSRASSYMNGAIVSEDGGRTAW